MLGGTIGSRALGAAGKRALPSEQAGPRPAAVRPDAAQLADDESRTARATKP